MTLSAQKPLGQIRQFPVIGVEVENSTHCHLIQKLLREALLECFPKSRAHKKKEYITDSTFNSICEGRALCKKLFKVSRYIASLMSRATLQAGRQAANHDAVITLIDRQ